MDVIFVWSEVLSKSKMIFFGQVVNIFKNETNTKLVQAGPTYSTASTLPPVVQASALETAGQVDTQCHAQLSEFLTNIRASGKRSFHLDHLRRLGELEGKTLSS